jgi:hypothetical protein
MILLGDVILLLYANVIVIVLPNLARADVNVHDTFTKSAEAD